MSLSLTFTDLFAGAGGSTQGAEAAGATPVMAANHWPLAMETYGTNNPNVRLDCADISQVDPRRYPSTDILLASPECTHHSIARSNKHRPDLFNPDGDPSAERSRATMWDVIRFAEQHRYQAVIVENVVEVSKWAPFDSWLMAMDSLGYEHRLVSLNSMIADVGQRAPQSRDRLYVVFWRRENRKPDLDFAAESWCWSCEKSVMGRQTFKRPDRRVGKYRQQYIYTCPECHREVSPMVSPAAAAIDWDLPCPRIADREKPLADATMRRIRTGLEKFGPTVVQHAGHTFEREGYARAWPVTEPMKVQNGTLQHGVALPAWFVSTTWSSGDRAPRDLLLPFPTQTGRLDAGMAMVPAFLMHHLDPNGPDDRRVASCDRPLGTITAGGHHTSIVQMPFIAELRGGGSDARSIDEPMATVTASGNHHGLLMPSFYMKQYGDGSDPTMSHDLGEPLGAVTTKDHHALVAMPFVSTYYGNGGSAAVVEPMATATGRDRHALVMPDIDVMDCGFRMFEPHEVQAGMAFARDYEVKGSKRDRVKQLGNAVTPPAMGAIARRVIESLAK